MRLALLAILSAAVLMGDFAGVFSGSTEHPAIEYATRPTHDAPRAFNDHLDQGIATLEYEAPHGFLESVLKGLNVPVESQIVTFAKNSLQQDLINPRNARALYFNDEVTVGWVRGGLVLEIAAEDPEQGTIFYTVNQIKTQRPRLKRRDSCLSCHESYDTMGVPGMLLRSTYPAPDGFVMRELGNYNVDHRTAFAHRWGGWFVTGKTDALSHLGNAAFKSENEAESVDQDFKPFLRSSSDIVALMVFDHQMHMTNLLTRAGWETRFGRYEKTLTPEKLAGMAAEVADYLLFVDEARLNSPVEGASGFAQEFAARGPFDGQGRSLRQFDLNRRLMKYPLSYMIYSRAFDALPVEMKDAIYRRLWTVLSGAEHGAKYQHLAEKRAIIEILCATKKDLPDYFHAL